MRASEAGGLIKWGLAERKGAKKQFAAAEKSFFENWEFEQFLRREYSDIRAVNICTKEHAEN